MNKKDKILVIGLAAIALSMSLIPVTSSLAFGNNLKLHGKVVAYVRSPVGYVNGQPVYGDWVLWDSNTNLITNRGKDMIKETIGGATINNTNRFIAIANNTVAQSASDTNLQGQYSTCSLAGKIGDYASRGTGNWSVSGVWTSSCDNVYVNATGTYNTTSSGNLFQETTFTTVTLQTNDQLNVTYYTWLT